MEGERVEDGPEVAKKRGKHPWSEGALLYVDLPARWGGRGE